MAGGAAMTVRQLGQRSDERLRLSVRHERQKECPQDNVAGSWRRLMQIGHSKAFSSESGMAVASAASNVSSMALAGRRGTGESSATPAEPSATTSDNILSSQSISRTRDF